MIKSCPLCNSDSSILSHDALKDYLTGDQFSIKKCNNCSLALTVPRPIESERYYPARYREYAGLVKNLLGMFYAFRVSRWLRANPGPGTVLEVGCGAGDMLQAFLQKGWCVVGTERSSEMSRAAKLKGITVFAGGFQNIPKESRFDLIIFFQVLEHLEDPAEAISFAGNHLADNGKIIISVPNFSSFQSRVFGRHWFHLDVPRHLSHFSLQSLEYASRREGLEILRYGFFSPEHDPYGLFQSVLNKFFADDNHFTRMLMGMDSFCKRDFLKCVIGLLMSPVFLASIVSGIILKNGPIIQIEIVKPAKS